MLELPITIRTPRPDEVSSDYLSKINLAKSANIVEGYTLYTVDDPSLSYNFYAEINVDNSRFWSLFTTFLLSYNTEVSLLFGHVDTEPFLGRYSDKFEILNAISEYSYELSVDPFLEFGIVYSHNGITKEAYVKKPKYIQYWGVDFEEFDQIMQKFSIYKSDDLNFIDEYPMVSESVRMHNDAATDTGVIIEKLTAIFTE
ncbi:hypothetical protein ACLI09_06450 [Flavobacterium sp. RHBU_24]|uniref:hypothetical protein n=1 Tax=Flavobacterium sp. RHBU_24 TaxID=3391185 RepID=UPI0039853B95